jgi:peroxin-10
MVSIKNFRAGQAEIFRAAQKDEQVTDRLSDLVFDVGHMFVGNRRWLKSENLRETIASVLYYGFTTVPGFQTLGEEYTGIIQINKANKNVPDKFLRIVMVIFSCVGEVVFRNLLRKLEEHLKLSSNVTQLRPEIRSKLLFYAGVMKDLIPYLHRLHKGIFYLDGNYYHISKRFTGVKYILVRQWLKAEVSHSGFKILGVISLLYLLLLAVHTCVSRLKLQPASGDILAVRDVELTEPETMGSQLRCTLCLETRKNTSVTPCGHLFCWNCILEWVQTQQICPLCRERVMPSRVVLLQNYDSTHRLRQI